MKFHCYMDWKEQGLLLEGKDAGIDRVDLSLYALAQAQQQELVQLSLLLRSNEMEVCALYEMFPPQLSLAGNWVDYQKIDRCLFDALEKAAVFCPQTLIFDTAALQNLPDGFSKEYVFKQLCYLLKERVAPILQQHRVRCAVAGADSYALAKAVGSAQIGVLADCSLLQQKECWKEPCLPIVYAQIEDFSEQSRRFLSLLTRLGYEGGVSVKPSSADVRRKVFADWKTMENEYC